MFSAINLLSVHDLDYIDVNIENKSDIVPSILPSTDEHLDDKKTLNSVCMYFLYRTTCSLTKSSLSAETSRAVATGYCAQTGIVCWSPAGFHTRLLYRGSQLHHRASAFEI